MVRVAEFVVMWTVIIHKQAHNVLNCVTAAFHADRFYLTLSGRLFIMMLFLFENSRSHQQNKRKLQRLRSWAARLQLYNTFRFAECMGVVLLHSI